MLRAKHETKLKQQLALLLNETILSLQPKDIIIGKSVIVITT